MDLLEQVADQVSSSDPTVDRDDIKRRSVVSITACIHVQAPSSGTCATQISNSQLPGLHIVGADSLPPFVAGTTLLESQATQGGSGACATVKCVNDVCDGSFRSLTLMHDGDVAAAVDLVVLASVTVPPSCPKTCREFIERYRSASAASQGVVLLPNVQYAQAQAPTLSTNSVMWRPNLPSVVLRAGFDTCVDMPVNWGFTSNFSTMQLTQLGFPTSNTIPLRVPVGSMRICITLNNAQAAAHVCGATVQDLLDTNNNALPVFSPRLANDNMMCATLICMPNEPCRDSQNGATTDQLAFLQPVTPQSVSVTVRTQFSVEDVQVVLARAGSNCTTSAECVAGTTCDSMAGSRISRFLSFVEQLWLQDAAFCPLMARNDGQCRALQGTMCGATAECNSTLVCAGGVCDAFFVALAPTQSIESLSVNNSGCYRIVAVGGHGGFATTGATPGNGGKGAVVDSFFELTPFDQLLVVVAGDGTNGTNSGGGGGASSVFVNSTSVATLLLMAGGGAGAHTTTMDGCDARTDSFGGASDCSMGEAIPDDGAEVSTGLPADYRAYAGFGLASQIAMNFVANGALGLAGGFG
ncbi:MAG: hypothetical protein MHM6MM_006116, partial [Cercozoa sp. M6MM]